MRRGPPFPLSFDGKFDSKFDSKFHSKFHGKFDSKFDRFRWKLIAKILGILDPPRDLRTPLLFAC